MVCSRLFVDPFCHCLFKTSLHSFCVIFPFSFGPHWLMVVMAVNANFLICIFGHIDSVASSLLRTYIAPLI